MENSKKDAIKKLLKYVAIALVILLVIKYWLVTNSSTSASLSGIYYLRNSNNDTYTDIFVEFDNRDKENKKVRLYSAEQYNGIEPEDDKMPLAALKTTYTIAGREANHVIAGLYYEPKDEYYFTAPSGSLIVFGGLFDGETECRDMFYQELENEMPEEVPDCKWIFDGDIMTWNMLEGLEFIKIDAMPSYYDDLYYGFK